MKGESETVVIGFCWRGRSSFTHFSGLRMIRKQIVHSTKLSSPLRSPLSPAPNQAQECVTWLGSLRALRPLTMVLLVAMLVLAGCGPSREESSSTDLAEVTKEIAYTYAGERDLATAQSALNALDVANANQWLVLVAEQTIAEGPSGDADALTMLSTDLGLSSAIVARYAEQRGFTSAAVSAPATLESSQQPTSIPASNVEQSVAQVVPPTEESSQEAATAEPDSPAAETAPVETPTPVTEPDAPTPVPTETAAPAQVQAVSPMNVRAGPSTEHPIVAAMQTGTSASILAKNGAGDWWQVSMADGSVGWIYAPLVETVGNVGEVSIAAAIPTAPPVAPTATPAPAQAPPPAAPVSEPEPTPPADQPTAAPPPPSGGPDFRLVEQRLWDVAENGGFLAGSSVNCGEKQVLEVIVEDASGARLNGVTVQGVYRNELHVTGSKGDGVAQMDINKDGDDVIVLRDVDGREVSSDRAVGNTARTYDIPHNKLIEGRFCTDTASCQAFVNTNGCFGHFSWTVRFRRSY